MDSWQTLGCRSFMTLIRCFSCADPVVSNLWWFKSSREIVMSLKTTRGVTWENQILWSPAHCEAVVTCGLQSRSLVTAVSTDVRQEKTNIMKLANEVLPEFSDPFFLPPVSRVATWVCDLSCLVRISCPPPGPSVCSRVDPAPICIPSSVLTGDRSGDKHS